MTRDQIRRTAQPTEAEVESSPALNELGQRIRSRRLAAGLTLEQLAIKSGFGKAYLSRIENGKKMPPIATLSRLADVLGTEAASLLAVEKGAAWRGVSVVRHDEKRPTVLGGSAFGYDYFALSNVTEHHALQPFLFAFPAEIDRFVFFQHEGEELLYVLSGSIEWQVGADKYRLDAGDTIHFDSRIPHRGHSLSGPATALVIMHSSGSPREGLA
jgi:transcriptional regulator with XRE-family HTH domain